MDRMIHTALNTLNNLYMNRAVKSQNLSNLNVPGFRRDMGTTFSSGFLTEDKRFDARIFALHEGANVFLFQYASLYLLYLGSRRLSE